MTKQYIIKFNEYYSDYEATFDKNCFDNLDKMLPLVKDYKFWDTIGSIELSQDEEGLYIKNINLNQEYKSSIKNDAEESLSIGYRVKKCRYESRTRIIEKVDILEISIDSKELKLNK